MAEVPGIDVHLSRIDAGTAWVSAYWGYNAPKLVYDGESFYTVGLWGAEQATARGVLYRSAGNGVAVDGWEAFYEWGVHDYQPGMVLLDSQQRLVLVHARIGGGPRILHQQRRGDPDSCVEVSLPAGLAFAGYIGAAMDGDRLILGFIGYPSTYSFAVAWVDLGTGAWSGPVSLAREQRMTEPYTTWLYPLIVPDGRGFHLVVSNAADLSSYYSAILYQYVPYDDPAGAVPTVVAEVNPWTRNLAFGEALWRGADGTLYVTGQYQPEGESNRLVVFRREPRRETWEATEIGGSQVAAVWERPRGAGGLWLVSTAGSSLALYRGVDGGRDWETVGLPPFDRYGLQSTFFLYGIAPASGSLLPPVSCAVFSSGAHPQLEQWFVQFGTDRGTTTVVASDQEAGELSLPPDAQLWPAHPNPFNTATIVPFHTGGGTRVDVAVYDLLGRRLATLAQGDLPAGPHQARWDGTDVRGRALASGVYAVRLTSGETVLCRKVVLLR